MSVTDAVGCATLGLASGMFGALLGAAGSAALLAFSGDHASTLEQELQRKTRESQKLEMDMAKVQNAMDNFKTDETKLVSPSPPFLAWRGQRQPPKRVQRASKRDD